MVGALNAQFAAHAKREIALNGIRGSRRIALKLPHGTHLITLERQCEVMVRPMALMALGRPPCLPYEITYSQ